MEWEKRRFFLIIAPSPYHIVLKEVENHIIDTIALLDAHVYVNDPYQQSCGIIIILCKYYIVISDKLMGSWIRFFVAWCSIVGVLWKIKKKRLNYSKST